MPNDQHLTADLLLQAYRVGVFPMSESRDSPEVFWVDPKQRGIMPLDGFHISRNLRRTLLRGTFTITADTCFADVVRGCADRDETWINDTIFALYEELHASGHAHSIEVWEDDALVGGVYGVAIGGAFFGESMFSRATNASKTALAYMIDRLNAGGFTLFDTQFITDHLATLGAVEIPRAAYHKRLTSALETSANFNKNPAIPTAQDVVQRNDQTS
jgi:leucyl/phenylalanyl-tRNA--protein transferase